MPFAQGAKHVGSLEVRRAELSMELPAPDIESAALRAERALGTGKPGPALCAARAHPHGARPAVCGARRDPPASGPRLTGARSDAPTAAALPRRARRALHRPCRDPGWAGPASRGARPCPPRGCPRPRAAPGSIGVHVLHDGAKPTRVSVPRRLWVQESTDARRNPGGEAAFGLDEGGRDAVGALPPPRAIARLALKHPPPRKTTDPAAPAGAPWGSRRFCDGVGLQAALLGAVRTIDVIARCGTAARTLERLVLVAGRYSFAEGLAGPELFRPESFDGLEIPLARLWKAVEGG